MLKFSGGPLLQKYFLTSTAIAEIRRKMSKVSVRCRTISLGGTRAAVEVLHSKVAFAGSVLQSRAVEDGYGAALVLDQAAALQNSRRQTHAGTPGAKHLGQELVGDVEYSRVDPVLAHEQPACQALLDFMQAVASSNLRDLQALDQHVAVPYQPHLRRRAEGIYQNGRLHSEPASQDLHDCPVRSPVQPDREGRAHNSLFTDNCHFDASTVAGEHDQRGHAVIQDISELDLFPCLVQDVLLRQVQWLQVPAKQIVFKVRNGLQDGVLDRPSRGIDSYAPRFFSAICTFHTAPLQLSQDLVCFGHVSVVVAVEACLFDNEPKFQRWIIAGPSHR